MAKEKRIIQTTIDLQEALFKYKKLLKSLPDNISKDQKKELVHETFKCVLATQKHFTEALYLIKCLEPKLMSKINMRDYDRANGIAEAFLMMIDIEKNIDKENEK